MNEQTQTIVVEEEEIPPTVEIIDPARASQSDITPIDKRREMVPVGQTGVAPMNLMQQVDYAQVMAKAVTALPKHLRNHVGDCLAVIDIANRVGLSPYMLANKTYVQNDRLCFESQLFHALLVQSGRLVGDLKVRYDGDGNEMTCTVWGTLRGEKEPHSYTSPPLKELHPGRVNKEGKVYVKGSPLWDRKPKVQMFYDTSRDWTRMFCPVATLGIYTPEEIAEYDDRPSGGEGLKERLARTDTAGEGFRDGHIERELAQIATGDPRQEILPPDGKEGGAPVARPGKIKAGVGGGVGRASEAHKAAQGLSSDPPRVTTLTSPKGQPSKAAIKAAADRAEATSKANAAKAAKGPDAPPIHASPKTPADYFAYCRAWIVAGKNPDDLEARWDGEREMRDELKVTIKARKELEDLLHIRVEELR